MSKKPSVEFGRPLFLLILAVILLFVSKTSRFLPLNNPKPVANQVLSTPNPFPNSSPEQSTSIAKGTYVAPTPQNPDSGPWGVSKQLTEHTYTIKVGMDDRMASPQEILQALNTYRAKYGSQPLTWNQTLAVYAQDRADYFNKINNLDDHAGFKDFLDNQDGFNKLGFDGLGENSSIGYQLLAVHLIEWIYASDEGHNKNQLNNNWAYVGIGVMGTATDIIFGTGKH